MYYYNEFFDKLNKLDESYELEETFQTHGELNQQLFDQHLLREDVRRRLVEIADLFIEDIKEQSIPINVIDYWLLGSNAAYNYGSKSDIDIHIIVNMEDLGVDPYILQVLYDYVKSDFNSKYDIMVKGHEVELYIEDVRSGAVTNGIYSLKKDKWVKEPIRTEIMSYDVIETDEYQEWYNRYLELKENEIEDFINDLYLMRKESLAADGEWGTGNLVFKEFRNSGILQDLKDRKYKYKSKELTLENLEEDLLLEVTSKELNTLLTKVKKELDGKGYTYKIHQEHGCVDIFFNRTLIGQAYPKFEKKSKEYYTLVKLDDCSDIQDGDILYAKRLKNGSKPKIIGIDYIKNVNNIAPDGNHFNANVTSIS